MRGHWRALSVSFVLVLFACSSAGNQTANATPANLSDNTTADSIVVGVFPFLPAAQIDATYGLLIRKMSEDLEMDVQLRTSTTFEKFSDALEEGRYDIAVVQPFDYPALADAGYQSIARVALPLVATLVAAADLEIRQPGIAGIAALRIGTPPESSAMRWLLDAELIEAGVDPATLDIQSFRTHAECLAQLQLRAIDVCAVAPLPLRTFQENTNETLQTIAVTEPVSSIAFVGHPDLDPDLALQVQAFLLHMDDDADAQGLLDLLGLPGFTAIGTGDYSRVRELLATQPSG